MGANVAANVARILWVYMVTSAHFADGAEKFTAAAVEEESNRTGVSAKCWVPPTFNVGPLAFASGTCAISSSTICSPTCAATATLRSLPGAALCGQVRPSLHHRLAADQYLQMVSTIHKWALPDRFLSAAS